MRGGRKWTRLQRRVADRAPIRPPAQMVAHAAGERRAGDPRPSLAEMATWRGDLEDRVAYINAWLATFRQGSTGDE